MQLACFNTQPPEGGCYAAGKPLKGLIVSTHSRPKAAACKRRKERFRLQSFNTQPPEGGCMRYAHFAPSHLVSTHSRPKAAANPWFTAASKNWFQHTAARRRLQLPNSGVTFNILFQHTAARRRLLMFLIKRKCEPLFQHTAARRRLLPT